MKLKWLLLLPLLVFLDAHVIAQDSCNLRISVMTCGTGQELYSAYGHSAVRVVDRCAGTDMLYNYGGFNFAEPNFYVKFTRGKLKYYVFAETMESFMSQYVAEGRSVTEQVLNLQRADARAVQQFLTENLKEENKYYRYDFLFDNCSTRIRDLLQKVLNERLVYHPFIANDSVSFRTLLNHYEREMHWERFGINLLMSHVVDQRMSSFQSMFLPDYLLKGLASATVDGNRLVAETRQLLPETQQTNDLHNEPQLLFWGLLIIVLLVSNVKKMETPLLFFDVFLFMIIGLLGWLMLFMWFATEHQVCARNLNLLWAFPLHLVFALLIARQSPLVPRYARLSSYLLIAGVLYSFFSDQKYFAEVIPLIILLMLRLHHYAKRLKHPVK